MTGDWLTIKRRIGDALEALRIGLEPYVSRDRERALGDRWQIRTSRKARRKTDFSLVADGLHKLLAAAGERVPLTASGWGRS